MQKILDNRDMPAFPVPERDGEYIGLTKWEYFAAHAPEVPDWFPYNSRDSEGRFFHWRKYYANRMCPL